MPTVDDLRAALNDLAADTQGLSSSEVLRGGKRLRTRQRLMAYGGAAVAVAGVAVGAMQLSTPPPVVPNVGISTPAVSATATPARELFEWGGEAETEKGVYARELTFTAVPADAPDKPVVTITRVPGESRLPPPDGHQGVVKTATVRGSEVRVTEEKTDNGTYFQLEFVDDSTHWIITANPYLTDDGRAYGPSEDDLFALAGQLIELD